MEHREVIVTMNVANGVSVAIMGFAFLIAAALGLRLWDSWRGNDAVEESV